MEPEEMVRLWDTTRELCRDADRSSSLRRLALRQLFAAMVSSDEEMDAHLEELQTTLEQLRN